MNSKKSRIRIAHWIRATLFNDPASTAWCAEHGIDVPDVKAADERAQQRAQQEWADKLMVIAAQYGLTGDSTIAALADAIRNDHE